MIRGISIDLEDQAHFEYKNTSGTGVKPLDLAGHPLWSTERCYGSRVLVVIPPSAPASNIQSVLANPSRKTGADGLSKSVRIQ